jgi:hypothetical protein
VIGALSGDTDGPVPDSTESAIYRVRFPALITLRDQTRL